MTPARVHKPLRTGVRVIDLFTPLCAGQRIGIFAGSGVGKSTLLSMLARAARGSTPSSWRWSANAAGRCASSSRTRSVTRPRAHHHRRHRPAMKAR